jgi:hypothetical protein
LETHGESFSDAQGELIWREKKKEKKKEREKHALYLSRV